MKHNYTLLKQIKTPLLLALFLLGMNGNAWGNTATIAKASFKNNRNWTGNHASFTTTGDAGYDGTLKALSLNANTDNTITWSANTGCTITVTGIKCSIGNAGVRGFDVSINGSTVGSVSGWSTSDISKTGMSLGANDNIKIRTTRSAKIYSIEITFTITPSAPTIKKTSASVDVSISADEGDQKKLDMTTLIGVSDVNDFMPVAFNSNSYSDPDNIGSKAGTFTGKYFYATSAGTYTFTKPYVAAKDNCHTASSKTNGTITITVNRVAQSIVMHDDKTVQVTKDKSAPQKLDLSTCIKSKSKNGGAVTYSLVSGPTSDAGASAENNCSISGKEFYAWVGGEYTLRATAAKNEKYNSTYDDFKVTVTRLEQEISWSTTETTFVEGDEITATALGDVTLGVTGDGASYVSTDGGKATILTLEEGSTTAHIEATAAATDIYNEKTATKDITITSLQKQYITLTKLPKLKTDDATKKVKLVATSSSNRDSEISYAVESNNYGVSVAKESDGNWYLTYSNQACKGILLTASLAGVAGQYVAATPVSVIVKVIDPNAACLLEEQLDPASNLKLMFGYTNSKEYELSIPSEVTLKVQACSKDLIIAIGYDIEFLDKDGKRVGDLSSYTVSDHWNNTNIVERKISNLDQSITKMVFTTLTPRTGYNITSASYKHHSYANPSKSELKFETYVLAPVDDQTLTLNYANHQIELEIDGSENFELKNTPESFGECGEKGSQNIKIGYNVPDEPIEETAYLRIKDNTGKLLNSVKLTANVIGGLAQEITSHNVATSYNTTDKVTLTATSDRGLNNFEYSASPEGVVQFNGSEMTFLKAADAITITIRQPGTKAYAEAIKVIENVKVNAVEPTIVTYPSVATLKCYETLNNSLLSHDGAATVTLHGEANTPVSGSFEWTNAGMQIADKAGDYDYSVTFKPKDSGRYNDVTFTMPVNVQRAVSSIAADDKTLIVSLPGENVNFDLSTLVAEKVGGDQVAFDFVDEVTTATINGATFTPTAYGEYAIRATLAQTDYYTSAAADFTVSVIEGILFDGTNGSSLTADDPIIINSNVTIGDGESVEVRALTINGGNTLTIANGGKLTVGTDNSFNRDAYGNIIIESGGKLILNGGEVRLNEFTLHSGFNADKNPHSGQVVNQNKLILHGDDAAAYFILELDTLGANTYGWYTFSVPFPVDALHGITRWENNEWMTLTNEYHYAVMAYHEDLRARTKNGWKKYTGILQPGVGYTMTPGNEVTTYRFAMVQGNTFGEVEEDQDLQFTSEGDGVDRGWNSIGNNSMEYVDVAGAPENVVQMYDHASNTYSPVETNNHSFVVGAAYFVQAVTEGASLNMSGADGNNTLKRAPARASEEKCRISLSLLSQGKSRDLLVVTCDEEAEPTYTLGKDIQKMGATVGAKKARLWVDAKDTKLCVYNKAYTGNETIIPLSVYVPKAGEYTLKLNNQPAEEVYLRHNGVIVWNMEMGDYTDEFYAGEDNSYELLVIRHAPNVTTGVDATDDKNGTIFVDKFIDNGQLFLLHEGVLYDAQGKKVGNR